MFFGTGALKNFAMFDFLFNKFVDLQPCNFINKRLQHRCFSYSLTEHLFYRTLPVVVSRNILWTLSLLHMRMKIRVSVWNVLALQRLLHFTGCVSFLSITFFFSYFFVDFSNCLGTEVSLLKWSIRVAHRFLSGVPRPQLFQFYLVLV